MSKVLVDRELLNSALKTIHGLAPGRFTVEEELRAAVTAQPAEAEGVELVPFWALFDATTPEPLIKKHMPEGVLAFFDNEEDARRAKALHPGTDYKRAPYVRAAALSAVTAERDAMDPAGSMEKCLQAMRDRDAHAKTINQLRAKVEALQKALSPLVDIAHERRHSLTQQRFSDNDEGDAFARHRDAQVGRIARIIDAAMAAKEA